MPPTRSSLKSLQFISKEELAIKCEAEAKKQLKRFAEIEADLLVENNIFFQFEKLMKNKSVKTLGMKIFSYLEFESLIQARFVSKTWWNFLEEEKELWMKISVKRMHFLKESSLCDYNNKFINEKYPKIQVIFRSNQNYIQWEMLSQLIEEKGNVADFITFIQRREDCYDRKNVYSDDLEVRIFEAYYEFEHSPLEAAMNYGKHYWRDLKFLEMLRNHKFLIGIEIHAKRLVFWAVAKMKGLEALRCVLSILPNKPIYTQYDLEYGNSVFDAINYAISVQDLAKLKLLIPLATKLFWNSGSPDVDGFREGHSPLADAIMVKLTTFFHEFSVEESTNFICKRLCNTCCFKFFQYLKTQKVFWANKKFVFFSTEKYG